MKKVVVAVLAVLVLAASAYAVDPVEAPVTLNGFYNPTSSTTRTNVDIRFLDEFGNKVTDLSRQVKVWVRFRNGGSCGTDATIFTLVAHNGTKIDMKRNIDYVLVVPMMEQWWGIEANAKMSEAVFHGGCFQMEAYDPADNSYPGGLLD